MTSNKIYSTDSSFPFDRIAMSKPISSGGNHIIKFNVAGNPIYIQPPKCAIKGAATSKKHCDFVFSQENYEFLGWVETLENICQTRLFENRSTWFETSLETEDIENMFTASTKPYKTGKFYILRANVPYKMGVMSLKIYDENECETTLEQIDENMSVMSILEVHGIKCTSRNFQLEIEVKQILVLKPEDMFERCILKRQGLDERSPALAVKSLVTKETPLEVPKAASLLQEEPREPEAEPAESEQPLAREQPLAQAKQPEAKQPEAKQPLAREQPEAKQPLAREQPEAKQPLTESTEPESTGQAEPPRSGELVEVDFDLDKLDPADTFQLKQRNDVYYEMYRDARKKAKEARNLALAAYLEAKRIKNTYMLDELESDDSDLDFDEDDDEEPK